MIDDFAKEYLHGGLRMTRGALVWKLEGLKRTWEHSDATIAALPLDAPGHVPWWPEPSVKLFAIMVHVLNDSTRHAGHADILREGLDGRAGLFEVYEEPIDEAARAAYRAKLEAVAVAAAARLGA